MTDGLSTSSLAEASLLLAQITGGDSVLRTVLWTSPVLLAAFVGAAIVRRIRKSVGPSAQSSASPPAFTLDELGRMRERGALTLTEHEVMRNKILDDGFRE